MKIKTKIQFSTLVSFIAIGVMGVLFFFTLQTVQISNAAALAIGKIVEKSLEISIATKDFVADRKPQTEDRWTQIHTTIARELQLTAFDPYREVETFYEIQKNQNVMQTIFTELVASPASKGVEERLVSQLLIHTQNTIDNISRLQDSVKKDLGENQHRTNILVIVLAILFIGGSLVVVLQITNSITRRLKILHEGSDKIAEGNLDYVVDIPQEDEFGQLAHSFNEMAAKLKKIYSGLEQKVKERTIALEESTNRLGQNVTELEDAKKATLNLLEDLEKSKAEVEQAKAKDEAILANIGDGLAFTDLEKRVLLVNRAAENMLGWKEQELLGKLWVDIVRPKDDNGKELPPDRFLLNKVMSSSTTTTTTTTDSYNYTKKDGGIFPVAVTASKVSIQGEPIGAIVVFRDITKDKEVDRAKTEFISLASHQLRTPLSTIRWYTEVLLSEDLGKANPKQVKYIDEIYRADLRMIELVGALLNISRIELGTFIVEPQPTDIIKLAQDTIKDLKPKILGKKLNIKEQYGPDIPVMNIDPKLMRMVIENLLSNAVKYTPEKGQVDISIQKNANDLLITVKDTGYGIPPEQQDKIFTKLFRADNIRDKETDGTGLGLYLVKSIIDHSDGKVWFESEENKGTTFYVSLPPNGMKKKEGAKALS